MNEYMFDLLKRNGVSTGTDEAIGTEFFDFKNIKFDSGLTNATVETTDNNVVTSNSMMSVVNDQHLGSMPEMDQELLFR